MIKSVACQLLYKNGFWSWADLWDWQHEGALGVNPNVQIAWFCFPLLGLMSQVGGRCKICCGCLPPVPECRTVFPVEWDSRVDAMREALMVDPFVQSIEIHITGMLIEYIKERQSLIVISWTVSCCVKINIGKYSKKDDLKKLKSTSKYHLLGW